MTFLKNPVIQVISTYLILVILFLAVLYLTPRYIGWNKIYFAKIDKQIEKIKNPELIIRQVNK